MQHPERPLDLAGSIPDIGRVSIKASAGTGKTYSLTVLAVQHVVEHDIRPDQLLMVTYTREATSELRAKTRERAQETLEALQSDKTFDETSWMFRMSDPSRRSLSIERLSNFLARFDEVTVSTIHGFCQNVLRRGGLRSPVSTDFSVLPNIDHIIDQVITDHLLHKLADSPSALTQLPDESKIVTKDVVASTVNRLREAVKRVIGNQGCVVLPQATGPLASQVPDEGSKKRQKALPLALHISQEVTTLVELVHERCAHDNIITYDDLVRLVRIAVHPQPDDFTTIAGFSAADFEARQAEAQQLAAAIADQYRVIMVDEFQDTDAAQWSIFRTIYEAGHGTLITVGDPKQAIYRFRGADVNVYLDAVRDAQYRYVLNTNRRSDKPLLDAVETLLSGQTFDISGTVSFDHVDCDPDKRTGFFSTPFEIRYVGADEALGAVDDGGNDASDVTTHFMADLANEVVSLLSSNSVIPDKSSPEKGATRRLRPKDIAVLVHAHDDARAAVEALQHVKVPAVRLKTESVFATPAAMQWLILLAAIANPAKPSLVRAFGLSWFGGLEITDFMTDDEETFVSLQRRCAQLGADLRKRGMTGLYLQFRNNSEFLERILSMPDGERIITDLDHIGELLASHPRIIAHAGASECHEILAELVNDLDAESDEQKRRIETDEDSVVVMTMHTSKGLQFPIVFLPTAHKNKNDMGNNPLMFPFDFGQGTKRVIDVASGFDNAEEWLFIPDANSVSPLRIFNKPLKGDPDISRKSIAADDAREDRRRLLYVGLTRAEHKLVAYFSPNGVRKGNLTEPWAEVLATAADVDVLPSASPELTQAMTAIVNKSLNNDSLTTIEAIALPTSPIIPISWESASQQTTPQHDTTSVLTAATFERDVTSVCVQGYQRWSYSGITRLVTGNTSVQAGTQSDTNDLTDQSQTLLTESENQSGKNAADESNEPVLEPRRITTLDGISNTSQLMPMASLAGSAALGNLVHELLDSLDPSETDLAMRIRADVEQRLTLWRSTLDCDNITNGLVAAMHTPVAPITSDTVVSLGLKNRLSEMSFDFCLPQESSFSLSAIGRALLLDTALPAEFSAYAHDLASDVYDDVHIAGFMTGSIDAVFRVNVNGQQKYLVSDYKSNKLHAPDDAEPLIAYHPANLAAAMVKDGYVLQALIYTVALQRFLRARLPDYNYDTHIAGVSYLFLRGMIGHTTSDGTPFGVYFWQPARATIDALDSLFAVGGL